MKYGARNQLTGKVLEIKKGGLMSQIRFEIPEKSTMSSVITIDSLENLDLKVGDKIQLIVKAIHVLPVRE